jgi:serine/threonine-protein kinase
VAELFGEALEIDEATRSTWLATACGGEESLRSDVERLLRADARAGMFLQVPPDIGATDTEHPERPQPTAFGPFRVERGIGKGGMGEVWLATRQDGEFEQRVAIKQVAYPTPGLLQRFRRERQILAGLEHPNIARLIDGGVDAHGAPWLAMEYVEGEPVTDYVRRLSLDVHAAVRLFVQVCSGVEYAHQNLVVHRDLKPSNILVGADGTPKLLDFGIAKVLDSSDDERTAAVLLTPDYAAPEQWHGASVTTATDVYSLGVVLYQLLCGERPRSSANTAAETTRPSTVALRAGDRTRARTLARDLDRVIMHALAAEPAQRYPSVAAFREDLQRWLDRRPLTITRPSIGYLTARFVQRHRIGVTVSIVAIAALLASSGYALWQAQRAERFATRAAHSNNFLRGLFAKANPFETQRTYKDARDLLNDAAQRIDTEFADAPETQIELRDTIASSLTRIGDPASARELFRHNLDQLRQIHRGDSPEVGAELQLLALADEGGGDIDAARAHFTESWNILRDTGDGYYKQRISAMTGLAKLANRRGDHADAQRMHDAVYEERMRREGPQSPDIAMDLMNLAADAMYEENFTLTESRAQQAHAMLERTVGPNHARSIYVDYILGAAQISIAGHVEAGIATLDHTLALAKKTLPPGTELVSSIIGAEALSQSFLGHDELAVPARRDVCDVLRASKSSNLASNEILMGLAQLRSHDAGALDTLNQGRKDFATTHADSPDLGELADAGYGAALAASGNVAEGERMIRDARDRLTQQFAGRIRLAEVDILLADVVESKGDAAEANALREQALAIFRRVYGVGHPMETRLAARITGVGSSARR